MSHAIANSLGTTTSRIIISAAATAALGVAILAATAPNLAQADLSPQRHEVGGLGFKRQADIKPLSAAPAIHLIKTSDEDHGVRIVSP